MDNKKIGAMGEKRALEFLKRNNYHILAGNYRCRQGEIDIIAKQGSTLVFVEVKTRSSLAFGLGMEAVNHSKQQKIRKAAMNFLNDNKVGFTDLRFDVIDIVMKDHDSAEIIHIKNAF
ncbi:MAG: YraN family protein [Tepidanaerobacteraceae bacterium]|nr:YraN family protein [Tepidanaerobacteraceae bacterium]